MPKKTTQRNDQPNSDRKDVADYINRAFDTGDMDDICRAIGTAAKMHSVTEIAKKSGIKRESVYRAFAGVGSYPNLPTLAGVLDAMGLRLKVTSNRGSRAKPSRLARVEIRSGENVALPDPLTDDRQK